MRLLRSIVCIITLLGLNLALANTYPDCDLDDSSGICVSTTKKDGKLRWAGLESDDSEIYGFLIYEDGDVYIGPMTDDAERSGELVDVTRKRFYSVSIDAEGNFSRLENGSAVSARSYCSSPSASNKCFDHRFLENGDYYYVGEFEYGLPNGFGYYFFEGGYYIGDIKNDKFHGVGSYTSFYGQKYEGEFQRDAFEGEGSLTTVDGVSFVGMFEKDKRSGKGKLARATGEIVFGFWDDDRESRVLSFKNEDDFSLYAEAERQAIFNIQTLLKNHYFLRGAADGLVGPETRSALSWAISESGARELSPSMLDLKASNAWTSLSKEFLEAQENCGDTDDAWSSCFVVRKR